MKFFVYILLCHTLLNLIILYFFDFLKKKINVYDYPDNDKKLHKSPIPLMGGWIFLFNLLLFLILKNWSLSSLEINIIFCSSSFLLVGILDDKYDLSPYSKFLSLTISLILFFNLNESMIINKLEIYDYNTLALISTSFTPDRHFWCQPLWPPCRPHTAQLSAPAVSLSPFTQRFQRSASSTSP